LTEDEEKNIQMLSNELLK
jgi:hypothetical protein